MASTEGYMPSIGRGPKGALQRVKRDIIKINSKDVSTGDSKCIGDGECAVDSKCATVRLQEHKTYINFPVILTKNIKVNEATKCLSDVASAGENSRSIIKTLRSNSKPLIESLVKRFKALLTLMY
jgi:hypothetical protein